MLQGGLESRFIPELTDKTKQLIEGFFKITMDDELRDLAFKKAEEVERTEDDMMLHRVWAKSQDAEPSLDGTDYLELTLQLLQHVV